MSDDRLDLRAAGARFVAARFDTSNGRQNLMPPKMKNQAKANTPYAEAFAPSIRAASRKPRKPATPTIASAVEAVLAFALRPSCIKPWSKRTVSSHHPPP